MTSMDIEALVEARMVCSARLRSRALLGVSLLLAVVVCIVWFAPAARPHGGTSAWNSALATLVALLLALGGYEALVLCLLRGWQSRSLRVPMTFRFVNAIIEALVPTLMIADWSGIAGSVQTLGGVLPWLYFLLIAASPLHLHWQLCWFVGIISAIGFYVVASLIAPERVAPESALLVSHTSFSLKCLFMIVGGLVAGFVASELRKTLAEALRSAQDRDRAVGIFGQHVSPQVARRLIEQPAEFHAELRHVCVLFLDIRGFSRMSAERSPQEVMEYLNLLFAPMITTVNQHGGIVNKFLGDGFMAIFGAPFEDPELHRNAVCCARALLSCVEETNRDRSLPITRVGIGLHTGTAVAGTVGSAERKEYTLLGDTVNTAARIEQETKNHDAQLLVSEDVLQGLQDEWAKATDLGEISLRGLARPLRLYRLA